MTAYVIMEPRQEGNSATDAVFIRDGFSVFAFIAPLIWLVWHRLWIEAALVAGASLLIAGLASSSPTVSLLLLPVAVYIGLEGPMLRINALRRRGWRDVAVMEGASAAEAEIRYYAGGALAMTLGDPVFPAGGR